MELRPSPTTGHGESHTPRSGSGLSLYVTAVFQRTSTDAQLIILSFLAPESPWWLVRNGKLQEAERSLKRLGGKTMEDRAHEQVANMVRTTQLEKDLADSTGSGRWVDIFKGVDLRRTEITVFVWVLQNFSGKRIVIWSHR
jgi:SP family general alpha glucoside:H+ symporter-like MFS transporter